MESSVNLERIIDSLNAVNQIKKVYDTNSADTSRMNIKDNQINVISEILGIIANQNNTRDGNRASLSLRKSTDMAHTYRELKKQFMNSRSSRSRNQNIRQTLETLGPTLNTKNKYLVEKAIKIYDILYS